MSAMPVAYHENRSRGTLEFPFDYHYIDREHPRFVMPYHYHSALEISKVVRGGLDISLNERRYSLGEGDCVIILDADLQQPPESIPHMLELWEQGYEDVYARRLSRSGESWLRRKFSLWFYGLLQKFSKDDVLRNVGDFRLLDRKCIDALRQVREQERYTKGLFVWIGYRKIEVTYEQAERAVGKSSFSFLRLLNLAIDGITSFSTAPLRISTVIGLIVSLSALAYMLYVFVKTLVMGGDPVQGFPTLIIVMLFLGGVQLLSLGIIGEYLARIFNETKNRPVYLIREKAMNQE